MGISFLSGLSNDELGAAVPGGGGSLVGKQVTGACLPSAFLVPGGSVSLTFSKLPLAEWLPWPHIHITVIIE